MTVFKEKDIENLKQWGNKKAKSFWMSTYSKSLYPIPNQKEKEKMKEFLKAKYVEKWFATKKSNDDSSSDDEEKDESGEESPDKPKKKVMMRHKKKNHHMEEEQA